MENSLNIRFNEFRIKMEETLIFVKDFSGEENINLKTSIERDLGISGIDADEFLLGIQQRFNVNLSKFEFKKYFHEEGVELIYYPLIPVQLIIFMFQIPVLLTRYIFNSEMFNKLVYFNLFTEVEKLRGIYKAELTVGDIITTVLHEEFKLKKMLKFV